jgi:hypothetical protein
MVRYVLQSMLRSWGRVALTAGGLAVAFSAIVFAYAVASSIEVISKQALEFVIRGANVWISQENGPYLSPESQALVSSSAIPPSAVSLLRAEARLSRVAIGVTEIKSKEVAIYADERETSLHDGVAISPALALLIDRGTNEVRIGGYAFHIVEVREALPGYSIVASYEWGSRRLLKSPGRVDWLVGKVESPKRWLEGLTKTLSLEVRDTAILADGTQRSGLIAYLVEGSISRFDPFSFRTKFSAYVLHNSMATIFGWVARLVLTFGGILVITSLGMSVRERRAEIAVFAVLGMQAEVTILFLIEALLLLLVAVPLGTVIAALAVSVLMPGSSFEPNLISGLFLSLFFLPVAAIVAGLWGGQKIAQCREVDLVRGNG